MIFGKTKRRLNEAEKKIDELISAVSRLEGISSKRTDNKQKTEIELRREWFTGKEVGK